MEDIKRTKRELILEAAMKVFPQRGYHHTRMEEIAAEAGIGKGTIYEYFSSKLHLFQEMMQESVELYFRFMLQDTANDKTFAERLRLLLAGHIQFCKEKKELTRIVFWDAEIIDEELKDWIYLLRKEKEERLQLMIQEGMQKGELRKADARLITLLIGGIIGSIWAPITLEDWDADTSVLAAEITDIILNGIKGSQMTAGH